MGVKYRYFQLNLGGQYVYGDRIFSIVPRDSFDIIEKTYFWRVFDFDHVKVMMLSKSFVTYIYKIVKYGIWLTFWPSSADSYLEKLLLYLFKRNASLPTLDMLIGD